MATWRYEISLWVLKNISRVSAANKWNIFSTLMQQHTFINTNDLPNHFTLIVFWCERCDLLRSHSNSDFFTHEDNMLFSHVKIPSFRTKAHLVFHWCSCNKTYYIYSPWKMSKKMRYLNHSGTRFCPLKIKLLLNLLMDSVLKIHIAWWKV